MRGGLLATGVLVILACGAASAVAYSSRVEDKCEGDYNNYCSQYSPDSSQTRTCMERHRRQLSSGCVRALMDDGHSSGEHSDKHTSKKQKSKKQSSKKQSPKKHSDD